MGKAARSAWLVAAAGLIGCSGLIHHDVTVAQDIVAGGGAPNAVAIDSGKLTAPLAASAGDLQKLSSVTLQSMKVESTDGGDVSFVSGGSLTIAGNGLPDAQLATLPGAATSGATSANFNVDSGKDLRAYLAAGALLTAHLDYSPRPVAARGLRVTLVVRGSL